GNPPYVRQELIAPPDQQENAYTTTQWRKTKKEYKDKLRRSVAAAYPNFFDYKLGRKTFRKIDAKSDLYVYFYLHGLSLLSPKGSFCFITSNSWLDVGYGKDLQEFLLKHSHVKIILDNQAKRSFAADVNTIIALLSPPDLSACNAQAGDKQQGGFDETARFVMFKVPFEDILSPVIFQEIEEATERMSRREFRVCTLRQRELYEEGLPTSDEEGRKRTTTARYEGNKWGGKYLRAPDIFFRILEKGKGKLVRLDDIAEVRRGFTTGANEFFYLDEEKIAEWGIEEEFLKPVIKSPRECKSIIVNPADLKFKIFVCHEEKQELKGANALDYIEWGEMRGFHERPSCRSRARWYDLGEWQYPDMLWSDAYNVRFGCFENVGDYFGDKRFFLINFNEENGVTRAYLNSTIISLFIETEGITNLGEGVIYTNVYWLKKLPVLNEESYAGREIHQCYDQIKTRAILPIFEEVKMEDRHKLDSLILDLLGLDEDDQKLLYEGVVQLVQNRITKADSV
nr:Eco57I restriction-modification methylase domain-containing protein [bacterium]